MSSPALKERMRVAEFLEWARAHRDEGRFELVDGQIVAMAGERVRHNRAKLRVLREIDRAISAAVPLLREEERVNPPQGREAGLAGGLGEEAGSRARTRRRVVGQPPSRLLTQSASQECWRILGADLPSPPHGGEGSASGLDCEAFVDGVGVSPAEFLVRVPDVVVHCGEIDDDAMLADHPVVLVEVVSPSSEQRDVSIKLREYFSIPAVQHYLIVYDERRYVVHHRRLDGDRLETSFVTGGELALDPPGLRLAVDALFAEAAP